MYEICQNEFRLGVTGDRHFSSRDEYDLDVKYRCIIASPASYPIRAENGLYSRISLTIITFFFLSSFFFFFFIHRYSSPRWIDTGSNSVFKSFRENLPFFYDRSKAING